MGNPHIGPNTKKLFISPRKDSKSLLPDQNLVETNEGFLERLPPGSKEGKCEKCGAETLIGPQTIAAKSMMDGCLWCTGCVVAYLKEEATKMKKQGEELKIGLGTCQDIIKPQLN